ncbi:Ppx/GppA family phosphatase [Bremerella cremea]|uniref:Ppx/GppA family phosphatase n=1 Tax=Bremerella cremea TaxID=1031537 RepID=A0A368KQZ3_9BACT|nr:Ppx/GppA phosphatase family protein [Bremerella cremea]RCS44709.1 Ppx/GppA family phosphatase [Bremerella cremea]
MSQHPSEAPGETLEALPSNYEEQARVAAIDIGSNSMRLVVAQILPGFDYRVLDEERESTRLAHSLAVNGCLDEGAIELSLAALRRFKKIAEGFGVDNIRTIATCAVREASNGEEFCRRAKEEVGIEIEVISSQMEGQLAFKSVAQAFDIRDMNVAIADIGGGSTEIVYACGGHVEEIFPTNLGCVRVTEEFGINDELFTTPDSFKRLIAGIDKELKTLVKKRPFIPQVLFGTGGTFTTLASMLMMQRGEVGQVEWGYRVHRADVSHMLDQLSKMTLKQRKSLAGLSADRADIIVAGIAVIDRLMHRLDVNMLRIHDRGIRDGLMLSMIEDLQPGLGSEKAAAEEQRRLEAMEAFSRSCGVDMIHTKHVALLAVSLFRQLAPIFQLKETDDDTIFASAMLQDVGYLINYEKHHKHSYSLILNSQLPGFSRYALEIVANVARYHRGANPKKKHGNFTRLSDNDQLRVKQLAAILRLAGALDRSHRQQVSQVEVVAQPDHIYVSVEATGDPEVDLWAARSRTELFCKAFNTDIRFGLHRPTPGSVPNELS